MESNSPQRERGIESIAHLFLSQPAQRSQVHRQAPKEPYQEAAHIPDLQDGAAVATMEPNEESVPEMTMDQIDQDIIGMPATFGPEEDIYEAEQQADDLEQRDNDNAVSAEEISAAETAENELEFEAQGNVPTRVMVLTSCAMEDIVAAYETIKSLVTCQGMERGIAVFVCDAPDKSAAERVFRKLQRTADEFLEIELTLAGCQGQCQPLQGFSDDHALDLLHVLRGQGSDQRYILLNQQDESACSEDAHQVRALDAEVDALDTTPTVHKPIEITAIPDSDTALADILQLRLHLWADGRLRGVLPLPIDLPEWFDSASRVWVDDMGRLLVFSAGLAAHEDALQQALELRDWVQTHAGQLAEMFPAVEIDQCLPVGMVMTALENVELLWQQGQLWDDIPCYVLQVHLLQQHGKLSLLVV